MTTVTVPVPASQVQAPEQAVPVPASVVEAPAQMVTVPASTVQYAIQLSDAIATVQAAGGTVTMPTKPPALGAITGTLPAGTVGAAYSATLAVTGGTAPYTWAFTGLPAGVKNSAGAVSGTPTAAGTSSVSVKVTDSSSPAQTATASYSVPIAAASTGGGTTWDGNVVLSTGQLGALWGGALPSGYLNGGGNWNPSNITQVVGGTAADGLPALLLNTSGQWPMWIPFPAAKAGQPSPNGTCVNLTGFSFLTMDIIPAADIPAGNYTLQLYAPNGPYVAPNSPVNDVPYPGNSLYTIGVDLPAGKATTVKIPLSSLAWPMVGGTPAQEAAPTWIYKFAMQQHQGGAGVNVGFRNVKFV
jgi:hypothetical protein